MRINRRRVVKGAAALAAAMAAPQALAKPSGRKPNIIIVLADDLGYGDVGAFGGRIIKTPSLDRMAAEGVKLTSFYASANICTPSRAGLFTGRYPIRTGLAYEVIQATDTNGLPLSEVTIAQALKPDYATALIGKWHLGHVPPFWPPTVHGFDHFFGLPYSHDMKPIALYTAEPGVELTKEDVDFPRLTQRFFEHGHKFIEDNKDKPFFLVLALSAPHLPEAPNPEFAGHSQAAAYGDVVEEVDANVGRLLKKLKSLGLDNDTLVLVTSDNGPWFEGSVGMFRDRKGGEGWDGGYRVPFIARQPGVIPAGKVSGSIAMNIDFMPTICAWAGKPPPDVTIDGKDLSSLLKTGAGASPHEELILFNNERVAAIRTQRWKFVVRSYYRYLELQLDNRGYAFLFDTIADPSEAYDVGPLHPDVVKDMQARVARARATFEPLGIHPEANPTIAPHQD